VKRYERIRVNYLDEDLEEKEEELDGFMARVFQHEIDHVNGNHILDMDVSLGEIEYFHNAKNENPEL